MLKKRKKRVLHLRKNKLSYCEIHDWKKKHNSLVHSILAQQSLTFMAWQSSVGGRRDSSVWMAGMSMWTSPFVKVHIFATLVNEAASASACCLCEWTVRASTCTCHVCEWNCTREYKHLPLAQAGSKLAMVHYWVGDPCPSRIIKWYCFWCHIQ